MSFIRSAIDLFLDFLETIVIALVIFLVLYMFVFQPHQVKGQSMYPTLKNGEYLLTNKMVFRFRQSELGDIIVFRAPNHEEFDYIKRIIGLPGDRVKLLQGKFYINGYPFDESLYLDKSVVTTQEQYLMEGSEIIVPANSYFVAGDNRPNSSDSRDFGPVPYENIVGLAWFRYWPPDRLGILNNPLTKK